MATQADQTYLADVKTEYQYGFHDTEKPVFKAERGLNHAVVDQISDHKNEPDWMRQFRHQALDIFFSKPMPGWGVNRTSAAHLVSPHPCPLHLVSL